jgi:hypothetical protein
MKRFVISELLLMSELEQRAKRISLHPKTTVVLGRNDTGKSSVLKSIYRTLGAEPAVIHDDWKAAQVMSLLRFTVDDVQYSILKKEDFYAVFDRRGQCLVTFTSVTRALGPFLAELLDFRLKLLSRDEELVTPPPAYLFLPYYVDQDASWTDNWSGFARLQQFASYRKAVAEYHTGIRPNEFYISKAALGLVDIELDRVTEETRILDDVRTRMQHETKTADFSLSLEDFREQLDELLDRSQTLLKIEEDLKRQVTEGFSLRTLLDSRIHVVEHSLAEVSADFNFATDKLLQDSVECPTCGAAYSNDFVDRFEIAKDEDRLQDMLLTLRVQRDTVTREIADRTAAFDDKRAEVQKIQSILESRREQVSLGMLLQSEGRKEVDSVFKAKRSEMLTRRAELRGQKEQLEKGLKRLEDKERISEILKGYRDLMRTYLFKLRVERLGESSYRTIDCHIRESGSDLPRALLAYYFSILHVMSRLSTSTVCPIVIDSPNQQAQDESSLVTMLEFIRDNRPEGMQLVLAVEDDHQVKFEGAVIDLRERNKLLQESEFPDVRNELRPMLASALAKAE